MRQVIGRWSIVVALGVAGACGKPEVEKQAEQAAKGAEQAARSAEGMAKGAENMAKGFEEMAKGLESLAGSGDSQPVEPVSFRELQTVFPDLTGWNKGKPTGEKMSSPVRFSQAEVTYRKDDASIEAKIVDSGFNQILMAPYAMFLTAGYERETEDGYEKSVKVAGHPGWETWNSAGKDGELNALVNKRFLVTFEGNGIDDTKILHALADKSDLARLAAMK